MRSTDPGHKAWAGAGALLTLLAIGLVAPGPAQADCRHPGDRPALGLGIGQDAPRADAPPMPAPGPKPCNGPQCSGKSAPPITPGPQAPPRSELWGLADEPEPVAPPGASDRAPEAAPARPIRIAPAVFHPPRIPR